MSTVVICGGTVAVRRHIFRCPVCKDRRRIVSKWDASPYYGPSYTCCGCGDSWSDGELRERPFRPRWRQEAIAEAKAAWRDAKAGWPERDEEFYVIPDGAE